MGVFAHASMLFGQLPRPRAAEPPAMNHKLAETNFRALLDTGQRAPYLLVPLVVVDELDGLEKSRNTHERWRAGYTLAVLDRVFANSTAPGRLAFEGVPAPGDGLQPPGDITIELLFDPPGHVRLPVNDDEIVDRVMAVQPLTGRDVTLLTYDTGQPMRARNAELRVIKLSKDS